MSPSAIRCPGCGAADTSPEGPGGIHTCVYCGVRYRLSGGAPQLDRPVAPVLSGHRLVLVGVVLVTAVVTAVIALLVVRSDESSSPARDRDRVVERPARPAPPRQPDPPQRDNPSVSVEAPPQEQPAPATAEFALETVERVSTGGMWIYGYLHNTSPFPLGKTKIVAVFYGEDGAELGTDSGYTEDDVIAAGARVPTTLLVSAAPANYDRLAFEIQARRPTYLPRKVEGLELEADTPRRNDVLGWKFSGKVHNKSGQAAKFVKVRVLAFNQDDKFAGHAFTFASADALADGATARFDGTMLGRDTDFKRFEFLVSGQPVQ